MRNAAIPTLFVTLMTALPTIANGQVATVHKIRPAS